MEISRLSELRPRFVWDIIDDAFDLYRERFALFFGVNAILYVPLLLVTFFCYDAWQRPIVNADDRVWAWFGITLYICLPLHVIFSTFAMGLVASVVDSIFRGHPIPTIRSAFASIKPYAGALLGAGILAAFATTLLTTLSLGFAWIFYGMATAFIGPAIVLEGRRTIAAFQRSSALTGTDRSRILGIFILGISGADMGRVCGIFVLIGGIMSCLGIGLSLTASGLVSLIPQPDATSAILETQKAIASQSISGLIGMALQPLLTIALTLLYFDLRVRRQGIDLAAQAEEHGVILAADPFGDANSDRVVREQQQKNKRQTRKRRGALT